MRCKKHLSPDSPILEGNGRNQIEGNDKMTIYGGCIEPEGRELDDETYRHECKCCGGRGHSRHWEAAEGGSLNRYFATWCEDCDHADTNA